MNSNNNENMNFDGKPVKENMPTEVTIYKNLELFEKNLPKHIVVLKTSRGDRIYVVGTQHFSYKSWYDVSFVIRNVKPKAVVLELCPLRVHLLNMSYEDLYYEASTITPAKLRYIFARHGPSAGLFYLSFLRTSANLTRQLGTAPGGECRRAFAEAKRLRNNCKVILGDRLIDITVQRAVSGLNLWQRLEAAKIFPIPRADLGRVTQTDIEKFMDRDLRSLEELKQKMPSIYRSFVTERDYILAHSLGIAVETVKDKDNEPVRVVGVVGKGHLNGVVKHFGQTEYEEVAALHLIPKRKSWIIGTPMSNGLKLLMQAFRRFPKC